MATLSQHPPTLRITSADDDMEISSHAELFDPDIDIDLDGPSDNLVDEDVLLDDARSEAGNISVSNDQEMLQDMDDAMFEAEQSHQETQESTEDAIDFTITDQDHADEHLVDADLDNSIDDIEVTLQDVARPEFYDEEQVPVADFDFGEFSQHDNVLHPEDHEPAPETLDNLPKGDEAAPGASAIHGSLQDDAVQHEDFERDFEDPLGNVNVDHLDNLHQTHPEAAPTDEPTAPLVAEAASPQQPHSFEGADEGAQENLHEDESSLENTGQNLNTELTNDDGKPTADASGEIAEGQNQYEAHQARVEQANTHPVVVSYESARFSLFPPTNEDESTQFLLSDSSLCSRSLVDLLHACREVLGNDISDEQELKLYNRDLDLEISEESAHAFSTSLAEILEVYLDLHQLDGVEKPEAFEVSLVKKERFTAGLSRLRAAVADGRGMSRLWEDWNDDNETNLNSDGSPEQPEAANEGHDDDQSASKEVVHDGFEQHIEENNYEDVAREEDADHAELDVPHVAQEELSKETSGAREQSESVNQAQTDQASTEAPGVQQHSEDTDAGELAADGHKPEAGLQDQSIEHEEPEEDLIDYSDDEEEDRGKSSQSSTVVGDHAADTEHDAGAAARPAAVTTELQELQDAEAEYQDLVEFEQVEAAQPDLANKSASDLHDELEHDEVKEVLPSPAAENGPDADNIDWLDAPAEAAATDNIGDSADPPGDQHDDEDWGYLAGDDNEQGGEAATWANEDFIDHIDDDLIIAPEKEASTDNHNLPTDALDDEAFDEEDEITFDDGEADLGFEGNASHEEQPSFAHQPSESPTGKRSFTEHLQGDADEDGSDPEAKRLRST